MNGGAPIGAQSFLGRHACEALKEQAYPSLVMQKPEPYEKTIAVTKSKKFRSAGSLGALSPAEAKVSGNLWTGSV
jgi:hypothetical protein